MSWSMYATIVVCLTALQFIPPTRLGAWAPWLPQFRFFGPKPLSYDPVCFFRGIGAEKGGEWHELQFANAPRLSFLWHPERRIGKAAVDLYRQIFNMDPENPLVEYDSLFHGIYDFMRSEPLVSGYPGVEIAFGYRMPRGSNETGPVQEVFSIALAL
jgi:hypothetical protein